MPSKYVISGPQDWPSLRRKELTTVLDPMILRAGDLFLAGGAGAADDDPRWTALSANLVGLAAFFDAVILNERLPVFDYDVTFPEGGAIGWGTSRGLVPTTNLNAEILVPVTVERDAYTPMKRAAMAEWTERPPVDEKLRRLLLAEMNAFDHVWEPQLDGTEELSAEDRKLAILLFGGLLFSGYSQALRGTHVLQSKRARLLGGVALGTAADDAELFARLAALPDLAPDAVSSAQEVPRLPSFLPFLIAEGPRSSHDLLRAVLRERKDPDVAAYREWRLEFIDVLARGGVADQKLREIASLHERLERKLSPKTTEAKLSLEMLGLVVPVPKAEVGVATDVRPRAAWGWCVRKVKGDHRKVLARLIGAQRAFTRLDLQLKEIWHGRGRPIAV